MHSCGRIEQRCLHGTCKLSALERRQGQLAAVVGEVGGGQYCTRATIRGLAHPLGTTWELPSNRPTYTKPSKRSRPLLG